MLNTALPPWLTKAPFQIGNWLGNQFMGLFHHNTPQAPMEAPPKREELTGKKEETQKKV